MKTKLTKEEEKVYDPEVKLKELQEEFARRVKIMEEGLKEDEIKICSNCGHKETFHWNYQNVRSGCHFSSVPSVNGCQCQCEGFKDDK